MQHHNPLPVDTRGSPNSGRLWNIALQHPSQRIRHIFPAPTTPSNNITLFIRLGLPYTASDQLRISVNDIVFGDTVPSPVDARFPDDATDPYQLEFTFKSADLMSFNSFTIEVNQPTPNTQLRLQVITGHLGNTFGATATSYGTDHHWIQGLPQPTTGHLRDATPVWWLVPAGG